MKEAWLCMLWTAGLSAVIAMVVALVIHAMTALIRRFSSDEPAVSAHSLEVSATSPDDEEIAVAVAVARAGIR